MTTNRKTRAWESVGEEVAKLKARAEKAESERDKANVRSILLNDDCSLLRAQLKSMLKPLDEAAHDMDCTPESRNRAWELHEIARGALVR